MELPDMTPLELLCRTQQANPLDLPGAIAPSELYQVRFDTGLRNAGTTTPAMRHHHAGAVVLDPNGINPHMDSSVEYGACRYLQRSHNPARIGARGWQILCRDIEPVRNLS